LIFIPIYALPLVIVGWAIGKYLDRRANRG
jgi:hypothetical protein